MYADGRWQRPTTQQKWELRSEAKVVERKRRVVLVWGVKRGGLSVPNGWWCWDRNAWSICRYNTLRQQRLQSLLADRLSVWTAGLISASMLAHNRKKTPTQLKEKALVGGGGEELTSESLLSFIGCSVLSTWENKPVAMAPTLSDSVTSGHRTHFTTPSDTETLDTINANSIAST